MKQSVKYISIFVACALVVVLLLLGRRILSTDRTEYSDPGLVPMDEQYSDEEMDVHDAAFIACLPDIENAHPDAENYTVVSTCLCTAKRVLRAYINADAPAFQDDTYENAKSECYEITVKHAS